MKLHISLQMYNLCKKNFQSAEVGRGALARPVRIRHWLQKCCLLINFVEYSIKSCSRLLELKKLGWRSPKTCPLGVFLTDRPSTILLCIVEWPTWHCVVGKCEQCVCIRRWLQLPFGYDSITILLTFDCNSTALRPLDEIRYDRGDTAT